MKLNNSFSFKNYKSQNKALKTSKCMYTIPYNEDYLLQDQKISHDIQPAYNTLDVISPQINNFFKVNQTLQHQPRRSDFQSVQLKHDTTHLLEDYERAISYNIINTHKTLQKLEKDCEQKITIEKQRFKSKEKDNKQRLKQLEQQLEEEHQKRLQDFSCNAELKKKNQQLRKRLSDLIYENNKLQASLQQQCIQQDQQERTIEHLQYSIQQYQLQIVALQQKMNKKIVKRDQQILDLEDTSMKEICKLENELQALQQQNQTMQYELFTFKQNHLNLQEQPNYENRVKQLIADLESQTKNHLTEINNLHDYYRNFVNKCNELEDKIKIYQSDYEQAVSNERKCSKENTKLKLQIETLKKRNVLNDKKNKSQIKECRPKNDQDNKENDSLQVNTQKERINQKNQSYDQENQVLANLVENIQQNSALVNGHIRKMFSLQNILIKNKKLLEKGQMMQKLSEYDNLIKAMGALFYTSKRMQDVIPCIFQGWKEIAFENKVNKIRNLLTESDTNIQTKYAANRDSKLHIKDLQQEKSTTYDKNNEYEDEIEDIENFDDNEEEEFMKVEDSQQSCSIIPLNQAKNHQSHSQYDEDDDISLEDEEDEDDEDQHKKHSQDELNTKKWDFKENDPEVLNAKLLEKYAKMNSGARNEEDQSDMIYVDENGEELDQQTVMMMMEQNKYIQKEDGLYYYEDEQDEREFKDIITADDYIDDDEEEKAEVIGKRTKLQDQILHQPSTSNDGSGYKKRKSSKVNQKLNYYEKVDENGDLYLYEKRSL